MSIALARKFRPRSFETVAVQSHVSNTLKGAIARGRVAHGYLLCGPRGVGKTTLARVLAMALNCERRIAAAQRLAEAEVSGKLSESARAELTREASEPCGECTSCQRIWSGSASLDVVEIDAASNRGVDDARDLRERAMYAPSGEQRYKVYIIDEAHMLTREAWNALLKVLEEPPPRVVFVFATTEPQKIAQAAAPVLSRLQRFDLKRIGQADIRARLEWVLTQEGMSADDDALSMIARAADGSMRDALSLTDQVLALGGGALSVERVREALGLVAEDEYVGVLDLIAERRAGDVFATVSRLVDMGVDLGTFLAGLADMFRAQLAVNLGAPATEVSERARAALEERRDRISSGDLLRILNVIGELEPRFRRSGQQQLLIETMLVRFALLDRTITIDEVLRELPAGGGGEGERAPTTRDRPGPPSGSGRQPPVARDPGRGAARADTPASVPAATRGDAPPPPPRRAAAPPERPAPNESTGLDLNRLVGVWDDLVEKVRRERPYVGTLLERALPVAVATSGAVTLETEDPAAHDAMAGRLQEIATLLRAQVPEVERILLRPLEGSAPAGGPNRMTHESIRTETVATIRKKNPVVGAAIDALDLELLD